MKKRVLWQGAQSWGLLILFYGIHIAVSIPVLMKPPDQDPHCFPHCLRINAYDLNAVGCINIREECST